MEHVYKNNFGPLVALDGHNLQTGVIHMAFFASSSELGRPSSWARMMRLEPFHSGSLMVFKTSTGTFARISLANASLDR